MATYEIGEKPGRGRYRCIRCNDWEVSLDDEDDRLPPCGKCGKHQNVRYRRISHVP